MSITTKMLNKGKKAYAVTARLRYSSGKPHGAIDIATPIGVPVYAPFDGKVVSCHDGVKNNRPWTKTYSGMPSNWILLKVDLKTNYGKFQPATIFIQHLSPGLKVEHGDVVKKGELLGYTGNTGNSTGPHIHIGGQWVRKSRGFGPSTRYDHVNNHLLRVWPPERLLGD